MPAPKKKPSGVRVSLCFDPPSPEEAIFAAQDLTDDVDGQAEIAASLMGLLEADVKAAHFYPSADPRTGCVRPAACRSRAQSTPRPDALRIGLGLD
jgi:hypothetical protein